MGKKVLIAVLCLGVVFVISFFVLRPNPSPSKPISNNINNPTTSPPASIHSTSLEESICEKVSKQFGDCKRILLYDSDNKIVFAESSAGIIPVLTNEEFTNFKKFIFPMMDFQEFKEEKVERGPIDWRVNNIAQEGLSIIYGFAEDEAKTIMINSEGNIQPNRFFVRDNLSVWYAIIRSKNIKLPVEVTVYNHDGKMIYDGNEMRD
ncbi:hypothetical protein [Bacillus marasmi]|uniref:hypothetical protein n=1 Tax=Bacillus marasmi TaxID=1926279 RepID=UPI0011C78A2B|nr:hypothetical protein [Bacillus marasmi]